MVIQKPTRHMKELCKELGPEYKITVIDLGYVIYRDFGNGYDLEIVGVNTTSPRKKATLYLWLDKRRIVKIIENVPQNEIGKWADRLGHKAASMKPEDFDEYGCWIEKRTMSAEDGMDALYAG